MNRLSDYRAQHGLSRDDAARLLSDRLGRKITANGVRNAENRVRLYPSWTAALGFDDDDDTRSYVDAVGFDAATDNARDQGQPGGSFGAGGGADTAVGGDTQPPPAKPPSLYPNAEGRLAQLHMAVFGAVPSYITGNDGYHAVWGAYAPSIASEWVKAARNGDKNAQRVCDFMESGGPMASVVMGYLMAGLACVYVSGGPAALGGLFAHFTPFRERELDRRAARRNAAAAAQGNGASGPDPWSPEGWVAADPDASAEDMDAGGARHDHFENGRG